MEEESSPKRESSPAPASPKRESNPAPTAAAITPIPMDLTIIKTSFVKHLELIITFFLKNNLIPQYFPFIEFGLSEPKVEDVQYHKVKFLDGKEEYMLIHAFLDVSSRDGAIKMSCHGVPITFKTFRLRGKVRVALKPFTQKPFSFGGVQMSFLESPLINYKLNLAALPFKKSIDSKLMDFIDSLLVYPGRVVFPVKPVDPMIYRSFMPVGMFAVRVKRLTLGNEGRESSGGLCSSCFGRRSPGAYSATMSVGSTIKEFLVPKDEDIEEESWSEFLLEVLQEHRLIISLAPPRGKKPKVGSFGTVILDVLKELGGGDEGRYKRLEATKKFELNEEGAMGLLTLDMVWLPIQGSLGEESVYSGPTVALFFIYVYSCNNLLEFEGDNGEEPDTYIELNHGGEEEAFSCMAKSNTIYKTRQPEFNYEYIIKCDKEWLTKNVSITVCSGPPNERFIYGGINLCILELMEKPIVREVRSINSKIPISTITLSARIQKLLH